MYIKKFLNFSKSRKVLESLKLFEAVLNIDDSVKAVLDEFTLDESEDPKFSKIALSIKNALGNDYKFNRYDMVNFSNDRKLLQVKTGKQTNTQGVAKVIRTILMATDQDFFKANPDIKDDTIQKFADKFIGRIPKETTTSNEGGFEIVSGDDIKFWYDRKNMKIKSRSELDKSCMAQGHKLGFIDFYCQNSSIKLVIKLDTDRKLVARALLWKLESCSDKKSWFLDRCYCNDNSDEEAVYEWLKSNTEYTNLNRRDSKKINAGSGSIMTVKLDKTIVKYYPYLDTFKFLYVKYEDDKLLDQGILSNKNSNESGIDIQDESYKIFRLQSTEGLREAINPQDEKFNNKNQIKIISGINIDTEDYDKPLGDAKTIIRAMDKFKQSGDFSSLFKLDVIDSEQDFDKDKFSLFQDSTYLSPEMSVDVIGRSESFFKHLSLRAYDVSKQDIWNDELSKIYDIIKINRVNIPGDKKIMTELDLIILGELDKVDKSKVYYLDFQDLKHSRSPVDGIPSDKRLEMTIEILNKNSKNDEALKLRNEIINIDI